MSEISLTGDEMLSVLEMVAENGPVSAAEAARIRGINRTVAHRLLTTLAKRAYVRRTDKGYVLGPALARLSRMTEVGLEEIAKPYMAKLAQSTGETVVLHGIDRLDAVVLAQAVGLKHLVRVEHTPGSRHPLCKGASGWSILAFQPEKIIQRVLKSGDCDPDAEKRIAQVRAEGVAISHDELQMGVHGISAPVFNRAGVCEASIGLLVPAARASSIGSVREELLATAENITRNLAAD